MIGAIKKLLGKDPNADDPYWDAFLNRPLADPNNLVLDVIARSPGGGVFAPKTDVHDPKAMSGHIVELVRFFGASLAQVISTDPSLVEAANTPGEGITIPIDGEDMRRIYPNTVVVLTHWPYDPKRHPGMGGQLGRQRAAAAAFHLRSYIRELGYEAIFGRPTSLAIAAKAGLGTLNRDGQLVTREYGTQVAMETVVLTNLPMIPYQA